MIKNDIRKCEKCEKTSKEFLIIHYRNKNYLCNRHRIQMMTGRIYETHNDPHKIAYEDNKCVIFLIGKGRKGRRNILVSISKKDKNKVLNQHWLLTSHGYVKNGNDIYLHRFIMDSKDRRSIDHINGNKLDNRKENLRQSGQSINGVNVNTKICGVIFDKKRNLWLAQIRSRKLGNKYLGHYTDYNDAFVARCKKQIEWFGVLSKIQSDYIQKNNLDKYIYAN